MLKLFIFISSFYILLISVIGYGIFFQKIFFNHNVDLKKHDNILIGFYGLFLITFISVISSLVVPANFTHNIVLHFIGILFFFLIKIKEKQKYILNIFYISIFIFSALLISKTHDDFSYYHLPFTKYLTEHKVIFGMSLMGHGYKLISSIFFLNSTFYLPFIEYYSFHFSLIFFLIFFNFFLIKEILNKSNHEITKFLYLSAFVFFNLSFNRLAEFGTDKAGQILIVILLIKLFQQFSFDKDKFNISDVQVLFPLLFYCISLKSYFITYILFSVVILFFGKKLVKSIKYLIFSKVFVFTIFFILFYYLQHFISTGCFISPLSITCIGEDLFWTDRASDYKDLAIWLEQWAKAGAGPNFRVEDPLNYIKNLNWFSTWIDKYFFGKVSDQLLLLLSAYVLIILLFKNLKFKFKKTINNRSFIFYSIILVIFLVWFFNHPQLRYGGYSIVFLLISFPIAYVFSLLSDSKNFNYRFKYLVIFTIIIFNTKNFTRINSEFNRSDLYKFDNFPFFAIKDKNFIREKFDTGLVLYRTDGHCWNTPSPCAAHKTSVNLRKINGYYFFYR
jgi:hypothetical protein